MDSSSPTCARHPTVETRLRCSSCDTPICPDCGREAAVGYKCPDCSSHLEGTTTTRSSGGGMLSRLGGGFGGGGSSGRGSSGRGLSGRGSSRSGSGTGSGRSGGGRLGGGASSEGQIPLSLGARATVVGLVAALAGGAVLAPVLQGGAFFLLSSGLIGWGVARAVYWATEERNSPYIRAIALTLAGFAVAIALAFASAWVGGRGSEIVFLAYPAAVYGGWIVVRQR